MTNKKGQQAIEFLKIYGWAILSVIICIGILGYFGVFGSGKYIDSESCFQKYAIEFCNKNNLTFYNGSNFNLIDNFAFYCIDEYCSYCIDENYRITGDNHRKFYLLKSEIENCRNGK
jgi:hypothetical protein